jgi:hypothetical protein
MRYKILLFAMLLLSFVTSCSKEADITICDEGANGLLLDRIESKFKSDTSTVLYFYTQSNILDSVVHKLRNGESQYKYLYDSNNRLIAKRASLLTILPIKKSQISGIDSFTYNSKNQIIEYRGFAKSDSGYILQNTSSYIYNNENDLEKIISFRDKDTTSIGRYFWENGNLIKTQSFTKEMKLLHEFFYIFDSFKNPFSKLSKNNYLISNKNNVIKVKVNDFTGILDYSYYPPRKMCYNSDGFLTKLTNEEGEVTYFYRNP